nr:hypothetical protein [Paracoccus saliphilus]
MLESPWQGQVAHLRDRPADRAAGQREDVGDHAADHHLEDIIAIDVLRATIPAVAETAASLAILDSSLIMRNGCFITISRKALVSLSMISKTDVKDTVSTTLTLWFYPNGQAAQPLVQCRMDAWTHRHTFRRLRHFTVIDQSKAAFWLASASGAWVLQTKKAQFRAVSIRCRMAFAAGWPIFLGAS